MITVFSEMDGVHKCNAEDYMLLNSGIECKTSYEEINAEIQVDLKILDSFNWSDNYAEEL